MNTWTAKAHELRQTQANILATILQELEPEHTIERVTIASPAGDEHKLRGIPVVGAKGVGGTIAGTNPLQALIAKQRPNR